MMRWIIRNSLRFRYLVVAGAVALMVFGVAATQQMPVDVFPEFAPPRVQIQTAALGLTAPEVESLVTTPLEQALNGIDGLDVMRSKSAPQLSYLELVFKSGTDTMHARQLVQERMANVRSTLPSWAAPPVIMQPLSATSRVMKIGLSSKTVSLEDMSLTAFWKIRARLLRVPGVANVAIWGEHKAAYQVEVEPGKLVAARVPLAKVMDVTAGALDAGLLTFSKGGFIGTGGFVETPNQRLTVSHTSAIIADEDLGGVPLAERNGTTLRLADVANIVRTSPLLRGDAVINDGPGLMLVVEKLPWGNTLKVTEGVEQAIDAMRPGLHAVKVDTTIFRPASFVEEAIDHLTSSLVLGAFLVVLVLTFFLLDWRAALISVITMPLSLIATIWVLHALGATINTMVLAGLVIALGAIVDDAIVDVENIVRRLRLARAAGDTQSTASIILDSSLEVRGAVVYASIIEALALLPIFFLQGVTGAFFKPLAFTYALAVLVSLLVAMVSTPALSLILFSRGKVQRRESPITSGMQCGYERMLGPIVRRPHPAYAAVAALAITGTLLVPLLGQSLFPEFKERDFLMHWLTKPGTSLPEERRIVTAGSRELRSVDGVRNFGSHIGQALLGEEIAGVDFGENWVSIDPHADYDKTRGKLDEVVAGYPGMFTNVETYLAERISEVISGSSEPIVVRILGPDLQVLRNKAQEVKKMLGKVKGVAAVNVALQAEVPQIEVDVDLVKARAVGVKPGEVRRAAATIMAGEEVGDIYRNGKTYGVHVWSAPESRNSVDDIRSIFVDTPSGDPVRLGDIATVTVRPAPNFIQHENSVRRLDVGAEVKGRDLGAVAQDIESGMNQIAFPLEHRAQVIGVYAERQAASQTLFGWAIVTAIGIFLILLSVLKRFRLAVLTFVTLPLALIGGVIGNYIAGGVISIGSLVGFFTVLGIVARNGIMMISHFQHLEDHEGMPFGPELVVLGARERVAPIMITALTTALALVPLIIAGNVAGQEIEYPMGAVILGGLVSSTIINLFVVPSLYLRFAKPGSRPWNRRPILEPQPAA